jgi:hypothetical protein
MPRNPLRSPFVVLSGAFCLSLVSSTALGQIPGERSINSGIWSSPRPAMPLPQSQVAPSSDQDERPLRIPGGPDVTPLPGEAFIGVQADSRAAVIGDSTRLNGTSGGTFLPSAIPVAGDPFFGSGTRAFVQGTGNSVGLTGTVFTDNSDAFQLASKFMLQDANVGLPNTGTPGEGANVVIQQAYGRYNGLVVGLTDTSISDADALPEILDIAGPNARVTVYQNGSGEGQGRLSYFVLRPEAAGLALNLSIENPSPEINRPSGALPGSTFDTFARFPDLLVATRYGNGGYLGKTYIEDWHVQFGSVFRSLGLENDDGTFEQTVFGWGLMLAGTYRFVLNPNICQRDAFYGSIVYGQGVGHYIIDLRSQGTDVNNNDAAVDAAGNLVALPALAWYAAYTHNWNDYLRSTTTYSEVMLQSIDTPTQAASPYHVGQYVQANLVYHNQFALATESGPPQHSFYTGLEWLYGQKEMLDGSMGHANRVMWVVAFSK